MQTYDRSLVGRVGWKMDLWMTMYRTCANGRRGEVDNRCIFLPERAPMDGRKLRLSHDWIWGHGADADVDYVAMHCVTLVGWRDVLW